MAGSSKDIDELIREAQSDTIIQSQFNKELKQAAVIQREKLLQAFNENENLNQKKNTDINDSNTDRQESTSHIITIVGAADNEKTYTTKLEQEIKNIMFKIKSDPKNLTSYLSAAKLYSSQGKQQQVVRLCEQGLTSNSNNTSPSSLANERIFLQQQIDMAKEKLKRRVDILGQCPHEVSCNIIRYLNCATAIHGVDVSRIWRNKFLNYSDVWKVFTLEDGLGKQRKIAQLLSIKSKYIKSLYINAWPDKIRQQLASTFKKNDFSNLRSLVITDTEDGKIDPNDNLSKALYETLPHIASTLTRLDVISQSVANICLGRILLICQNLKSLKLRVYSLDDSRSATEAMSLVAANHEFSASPLTSLEVFANWPLDPQIVRSIYREIFRFTPKLRRVVLFYEAKEHFDNEDMIEVVGNHCPKLKIIKTDLITKYMSLRDTLYDMENQDEIAQDIMLLEDHDNEEEVNASAVPKNDSRIATTAIEGIQHLDIHNIAPSPFLRARLEASCYTLQSLSLRLGLHGLVLRNPHSWQMFSSFTMYQLTTFRLSRMSTELYQVLAAILQRFPALETLVLEHTSILNRSVGGDGSINNQILNAITELSNLQRLEFNSMNTLFQDFFDQLMHHYQSTSTSTQGLKYLKIINCQGFSFKALLDISRITSLKELSMDIHSDFNSQMKGTDMFIEMFTNQLTYDSSRPQALSKLELFYMPFTDTAMENLITLCQRNTMFQEKLMINHAKGISPENTNILKNKIALLFHDFDYSDVTLLPDHTISSRKFIFAQRKNELVA